MTLANIRKQKYTQKQVADMLKLNVKTVIYLEKGHGCSLELALRYSRLVGYDIDPTGRVALAFNRLNHVAVTSVIHACREFAIPFDPLKLFEV